MATTSISLIREQTERVCPPRALWVPFALGRPLGAADDAGFQRDVMRAAFNLLETATAPVIEDYPIEAPAEAGPEAWTCPVNYPVDDGDTLRDRLQAEVTRLGPWALETRRKRGRTFFGASGASVDQVAEVARALAEVAESGDVLAPPTEEVAWSFSMPLLLRHLADDLRTFYHEAVAAQPGPGAPNHEALTAWIFGGTALGETLTTIADHLGAVEGKPVAALVRGFLIPEGHYRGGTAFPADGEPKDTSAVPES